MAKKATRKRTRTASARRTATPKRAPRKKSAARAVGTKRRRTRAAAPKPSRLQAAASAITGSVAGMVAAASNRMRARQAEPDAIELLEAEHRRFEELLAQGEETTERAKTTRRELLKTLTDALTAHELMEEKVLYPALQSHPQARDIVLEGYEEHHVADLIVKELHEVATDDEAWGAKFKVLKENIEHHIEEEEGEMFRRARGIFSRDELRQLAERMRAVRRNGDKRV